MGIITALEVQKRNKKRVNIFIDSEYAFSLSLDEAARLRKGQTISEAEIDALKEKAAVTVATDQAARFLSLRPRSVYEVRQNLIQKGTPPAVIDDAIDRLTALGYLDDQQFAAFWVQNRNSFKPVSPRALRYELRQKGIADAIIQAVLADLDAEDSAYRAAQGHIRRLRGLDRRGFRDKLYIFLQRRGFSFENARRVTARLIEEIEAETPDFFTEDGDRDEHDITET
ncbi:MAG: RecX family transcriptional regulator [Anaerolinea sp.]|nr:RecX family transcriptional regulator [Anaerolinea sp.]